MQLLLLIIKLLEIDFGDKERICILLSKELEEAKIFLLNFFFLFCLLTLLLFSLDKIPPLNRL